MHSSSPLLRAGCVSALVFAASCSDEPAPRTTAPATGPEADPEWRDDAGAVAGEARGLRHREAGAWDGYTLIAPLNGHDVYLVDMNGRAVHTWHTQHLPSGGAHLLPNGHLLRCVRLDSAPGVHRGGIGGLTEELDWDGNVVWECDLSSIGYTQHHDLHPLANGNVLLIARQFHAHEDALANGRDPRGRRSAALWSDLVLEVEPAPPVGGKIAWSWDAWDHMVQDHDPAARGYGRLAEHVGRIDINADWRNQPRTESPEKRRRREELEARMRAVGYAGDDAPSDAHSGAQGDAHSGAQGGAHSGAHSGATDGSEGGAAVDRTDSAGKTAPNPPSPTSQQPAAPTGEDWLHLNGIDYLPEHDLIALSSRHLSEVFVLDHSTTTADAATARGGRFGRGGELLYRWGNPRSFGLGTPDDQQLFLQHDVTWLPTATPDALRLLIFNNGPRGVGYDVSSVDEIAAPFDPVRGFVRVADRPFGPPAPAWSYSEPGRFYSGFIAGAQRLPNGNTLICEGAKGRVFEVRPDNHVVWDYWSPYDGEGTAEVAPHAALFHATRVALDHPGLRGRLPGVAPSER